MYGCWDPNSPEEDLGAGKPNPRDDGRNKAGINSPRSRASRVVCTNGFWRLPSYRHFLSPEAVPACILTYLASERKFGRHVHTPSTIRDGLSPPKSAG